MYICIRFYFLRPTLAFLLWSSFFSFATFVVGGFNTYTYFFVFISSVRFVLQQIKFSIVFQEIVLLLLLVNCFCVSFEILLAVHNIIVSLVLAVVLCEAMKTCKYFRYGYCCCCSIFWLLVRLSKRISNLETKNWKLLQQNAKFLLSSIFW